VESFIGAIALGYTLAEIMLHFVSVFASPVAMWATRNLLRGFVPGSGTPLHSPLQAALSPAISFVLLLLVWYFLLRWLYFTPIKSEAEIKPTPEQIS
jgi:hypothetical protein